jgi:hypothetical protein
MQLVRDRGSPMRLAAITTINSPAKTKQMTYRRDACDCHLIKCVTKAKARNNSDTWTFKRWDGRFD